MVWEVAAARVAPPYHRVTAAVARVAPPYHRVTTAVERIGEFKKVVGAWRNMWLSVERKGFTILVM